MMRPHPAATLPALACAALAGLLAPACATPAPANARAFVLALYAPYTSNADLPDPTGSLAPSIFTPALIGLIRADQRAAAGEVGRLGSNPLCACQDDDGLRVTAIDLSNQAAATAIAQVRLAFAIGRTTITLFLRRTPAGWRVDDVGNPATPSLKRLLGGSPPASSAPLEQHPP